MEQYNGLALLTDMYQLTMMQGYYKHFADRETVFDMFFRRPPFGGGYSIFAGLETLVKIIENFRFTQEDIDYLKSLGLFEETFLEYLTTFKFTLDVAAAREGDLVFPNEPLIRVEGNIIQVQLLETILLNTINFQTLIATKAARISDAAKGKPIMEFGLRRAQGSNGAISAARAAYVGGVGATSNVLAGKLFGIPVKGTMAHSWVMAYSSELESFEAYARQYPESTILLVDTYDTLRSGVPNAITVLKKLKERGITDFGIRLDSGDLDYLSKEARKMLDSAGLPEAKIVISNELDEHIIQDLERNSVPIDVFGVGTNLVTAKEDPSLTGVYKLVAKKINGTFESCLKVSNEPSKITNPGIKNVLRLSKEGRIQGDLIFLEEEREDVIKLASKGKPLTLHHPNYDYQYIEISDYDDFKLLLNPVIKEGKCCIPLPALPEIRQNTLNNLQTVDQTYKRHLNPHIYKVSLSEKLKTLKQELISSYIKSPD